MYEKVKAAVFALKYGVHEKYYNITKEGYKKTLRYILKYKRRGARQGRHK